MRPQNLFSVQMYASVLLYALLVAGITQGQEEIKSDNADIQNLINQAIGIVDEDGNNVIIQTGAVDKADTTEAEAEPTPEPEPEPEAEKPPPEPPVMITVDTFLGRIRGSKSKVNDSKYIHSFLGIPYAQPPTNSRRFKPPVPVTSYGELNALGFKAECPQIKFYGNNKYKYSGDEDCLFLNIFTPSLTKNSEALKPVMVWIHGGGFTTGSSNEYIPVALVMKDVVVVTLNYRLSGFGFMTFGNDLVSGNMGLRDQLEALKWVKRYITSFGGDPDKITIFGQSSGAVSVHALHLSPKSNGLISGAIAQSGTMLLRKTKWEVAKEERNAMRIAEIYNCTSINYDEEMLKCLQSVPAKEFFKMTQYVGQKLDVERAERERGPWFPVVDAYCSDPILPVEPLHALKVGAFNKAPMISGTVANEGALQVMGLLGPAQNKDMLWGYVGAQQLLFTEGNNITETKENEVYLAQIVTKYYTQANYDLRESGQSWMDMFTDSGFLSPDQKVMQLMTQHGSQVFNYIFSYVPTNTIAKIYGAPDTSISPVHAEDILFLFEEFANIRISTDEELALSDKILTYWTNFAKYNHPSPFMDDSLPAWKPYSESKRYMELKPEPEMKENPHHLRMMFWQNMLWNNRESEIDTWQLYQKMSRLFTRDRKSVV